MQSANTKQTKKQIAIIISELLSKKKGATVLIPTPLSPFAMFGLDLQTMETLPKERDGPTTQILSFHLEKPNT